MKQRRQPPVVVTKKRSTAAAAPAVPRRPTDTKIRTWHADAPKPEPAIPPDLLEDHLHQAAIDEHYARLRGANDPDVPMQAAKAVARVEQLARNTASIHELSHHNSAPAHVLFARDHRTNTIIGKVLQALLPGVTYVRQRRPGDTHAPSSLRPFVKSMRKGNDE
jgi:hypothetical protein